MEPRILAVPERNILLQALTREYQRLGEALADVATDGNMDVVRQHFAALSLCDSLQRSARAGHVRIMEPTS